MRHKFDNGSFIADLGNVVEDAKKFESCLIVVPSEREVHSFEKNFSDDTNINNIRCCSASDYITYKWVSMFSERPKHIIIFRADDIFRTASADARVEYMTSVGKKNYKKEENSNDEV